MPAPYEPFEPSLAVPSTPEALAEFRARPVTAERAVGLEHLQFGVFEDLVARREPKSEPAGYRAPAGHPAALGERFGDAAHRRVVEELGLVCLGTCFEGLSFKSDSHTSKKEVWATRDGAISVALINAGRYMLSTYFDDGTAHLTWAHASPRTTSIPGSLVSSGGTGNLGEDLAAHATRVRGELARGRRFLVVDHIETAVELSRHYYRQLVAPDLLLGNLAVMRANRNGRLFVRGGAVVLASALAVALFLLLRR